MSAKPHFRMLDSRLVEAPREETPMQQARRKYGRPFAYERGNDHTHTTGGASYWTPERINALAEQNDARRKARK